MVFAWPGAAPPMIAISNGCCEKETPSTNGLEDGQFTFDELYLHLFRRELYNLTVGRQQTRFVLRGGVFSRSLDRNDSNNTRVTWTDGFHFTFRQLAGWEGHFIVQDNSADGTGSIRSWTARLRL